MVYTVTLIFLQKKRCSCRPLSAVEGLDATKSNWTSNAMEMKNKHKRISTSACAERRRRARFYKTYEIILVLIKNLNLILSRASRLRSMWQIVNRLKLIKIRIIPISISTSFSITYYLKTKLLLSPWAQSKGQMSMSLI